MLTPSQIAEMAAVKYPFITDEDKGREQYFNRHITAQQSAYIAAFTDAMELMSKEWVSVEDRLPKRGTIIITGYWDNNKFIQGMYFYDGITKPFYTHWQPLPEPPVLTKDKKI